jgi:hypothetical protein
VTAAAPGCVAEPHPHEPTVHEWLDYVRANFSAGRDCEAGDSLVATVCASAVDPLEIAASLETSGISKRVVAERYGHANVFALAEELWTKVAFRPGPGAPTNNLWRVGNVRDLGRGALYAAPALMLLALTRAAGLQFSWWVLPLAITWGWALGQVTAYFGYTFKSRQNRQSEKLVLGWVMVATVISTADFASVAMVLIGGDGASILGATGVTTYMVASAILLLNEQDWLAAKLLAPGGAVTVAVLVLGAESYPPVFVWLCIGGSALATLIAAGRYMRLTPLRSLTFASGDFGTAFHHLVHGLMCGVGLTLVAILGGHVFATSGHPALFALPILVTLGVMEWQLRSFRAGVEQLLSRLVSLDEFAPGSWGMFRRALTWYLLWAVLASVLVGVVVHLDHSTPPYALLIAQVALGAAFYVDLTLVSLSRLDLVTKCWAMGFGAGLVCWGITTSFAHDIPGTTAIWEASAATAIVTLASLLIVARGVVSSSMSH